jgi:hypothetical protein
MDSVLATKSQKHTILNLKDCETSISALKRLKGQPGHVDLLLDQFSTSGCPGNPHDVGQRRAAAHHVLDNFVRDIHTSTRTSLCRLLVLFGFGIRKTRTSIPLSIPHAEATNVTGDKLVVMYPGDACELEGDRFSGTTAATDKYRCDWAMVGEQELRSHETYGMKRILQTANKHIEECKSKYQRFVLRRVPPVTFYVSDLGSAFRVNVLSRAEEVKIPEKDCLVSLSSQSAWYTFPVRFGLPSLGVSGRFTINHSEQALTPLKKLEAAYSSGLYTKKPHVLE